MTSNTTPAWSVAAKYSELPSVTPREPHWVFPSVDDSACARVDSSDDGSVDVTVDPSADGSVYHLAMMTAHQSGSFSGN